MDLRSLASVAWFADWLCVQLFNRLASYWLPRVHPCRSLCTGGQKRREEKRGGGGDCFFGCTDLNRGRLTDRYQENILLQLFGVKLRMLLDSPPKIAAGKRADADAEP